MEHEIDEHFYPYLAGFLDGEGSITVLYNRHRKNSSGNEKFTVLPCVMVFNTHLGVIQYVYSQLGFGDIRVRPRAKPQHRTPYSWGVHNHEQIISVLQPLLPFLIVKIEQAKLMMEYCSSRLLSPVYHSPYSECELKLAESIRQLNRVGTP